MSAIVSTILSYTKYITVCSPPASHTTLYLSFTPLYSIVKKYSNFVSFPVKVNGEVVNTVSAIWTQEKTSVTEDQYNEFYRFIANSYDKPKYRLHFRADAPIELKCLFYVPMFHTEKFGMGRTELGVNLYSRKVRRRGGCSSWDYYVLWCCCVQCL